MQNACFSPQKVFLFSRYLSFCFDFLVMYQNGLIKKVRLISSFMMLQPGQQKNVIHVLPNISKSKSNQTMKFGQLIECNSRNILLEKSYTKCSGETSHRPFSEKLKLSISLDQQFVLKSLFLLYGKLKAIKYIETKLQTTCFQLVLSFFKKLKRSGTSLPALFST